jgi:hypothetical protein
MKNWKFGLPLAIIAGGFLASSTLSFAKPEFVKKTGKGCTFCHVDAKTKPKDLKDAGKYYKEHGSLEGYKPADAK